MLSLLFVTPVVGQHTTLRDAAQGLGMYVGSAMRYKYWNNGAAFYPLDVSRNQGFDSAYKSNAEQEYDLVTAENACKPNQMMKDVDANSGQYTLYTDDCTALLSWANRNSMAFRGHALVWVTDEKYPDNFETWANNASRTREDLYEYLEDYIHSVMAAVGDIYSWDVVNEAIANSDTELLQSANGYGIKDNLFNQAGTDMEDDPWVICKIFQIARDYRDAQGWSTQLVYNDYNAESMVGGFKNKSDKVYQLMHWMVDNECGVEGVGFQTHIDINYGSLSYLDGDVPGTSADHIAGVKANMDRLGRIGLKIHFTEVDVRYCKGWKYTNDCPAITSWTDDMLDLQASVYNSLLLACIEDSNCLFV
jgi:GH35 family endo-1,4-beta-xylanase